MKVFGNIAALVAVLSVMGTLMFAQRDYQNSWREPNVVQTSATVVANGTWPHTTASSALATSGSTWSSQTRSRTSSMPIPRISASFPNEILPSR